jgi:hypothetical protein
MGERYVAPIPKGSSPALSDQDAWGEEDGSGVAPADQSWRR